MALFTFGFYLVELATLVAILYYCKKNPISRAFRYFSYYIAITVAVETLGWIPGIIYYQDISALKDSFLYSNYWLFNFYFPLSVIFYIQFFKWNLENPVLRKILNIICIVYFVMFVLGLFTHPFMNTLVTNNFITGYIIMALAAVFYFMEILTSDRILNLKYDLVLYIAISSFIYNLANVPFYIYFKYFKVSLSPEFVVMKTWFLGTFNYLLYLTFIFAFISCARHIQKTSKQTKI